MYRISLRIDGDITLEAFKDAVTDFLRLLREVEQSVSGGRTIKWKLERLYHGSPATMTWRGIDRAPRKRTVQTIQPAYARVVGATVLSGVRALERGGGRPESFSDQALEATLSLARVKERKGITALDLIGESTEPKPSVSDTPAMREIAAQDTRNLTDTVDVVGVTERIVASVKDIIAPRYTAPGAVDGRLQALNSRGLLYFVIYDSVFGSRVRCDIPPRLKRQAIDAFDERVIVSGMVARDSEGHPRHIDVDKIEAIGAASDSLPEDPDFTGGLETSEYLRRRWSGHG